MKKHLKKAQSKCSCRSNIEITSEGKKRRAKKYSSKIPNLDKIHNNEQAKMQPASLPKNRWTLR